ncbi:pyridoxal phosphate-dependent transferase [Aspergillus foveolatus]|uniref:pyridoxal phosphate-dependent transferase n=1 Tax=Aspergillus foveolatus TaxID=210207 RepID=UPI003CCD1DF3
MSDPFAPFKVDAAIHSGAKPDPTIKARAPTVEVLEKRAAVFQTVLGLAHRGDNLVPSTNVYGGTYSLFISVLPRIGITLRRLIDDRTKLIFVETVGTPLVSIPYITAIANIAHKHGLPLVVNNTFGVCGFWCPVIEHAVDIVIHPATKWLSGHGTTVGGVIVDSGRFDCTASGRFPHLTKNSDGLMEFPYASAFGNCTFALALRIEVVMEVGGVMNPFAAHQILLGIETLSMRCERIASNALQIARFLSGPPLVSWVSYPDCKTMAHPWSSTHSIMSEQYRLDAGVTEDLIRLSVGTEDIEDIIDDLSAAYNAISPDTLSTMDGTVNGVGR